MRSRSGSVIRLSGFPTVSSSLLCPIRALAVGPEVLLLDEPTPSLEPTMIEKIE